MTTPQWILESLCYYDERNPQYPQQEWLSESPPPPTVDCACDNCFYGRNRLAVELLAMQEQNSGLLSTNYDLYKLRDKLVDRIGYLQELLREALPSVQSHIRKHQRSWEAAMKRGDEFHTRKHCKQMNKDLALEARIDAFFAGEQP